MWASGVVNIFRQTNFFTVIWLTGSLNNMIFVVRQHKQDEKQKQTKNNFFVSHSDIWWVFPDHRTHTVIPNPNATTQWSQHKTSYLFTRKWNNECITHIQPWNS